VITIRNSVYVIVAACSVAMAACQPAESPAQRVARDIHHAAKQLGDQVDKAADKTRETLADARK
jgi:hypothetical protein